MKQKLSFLLALILLVTALVACSQNNAGTPNATGQDGSDTQSGEGVVTTMDPLADRVPDNLTYDGYNYVMAFPKPADAAMDYQILEEGSAVTKLDQAVYRRNREIEERFDITISGMIAGFSDTQVTDLTPLLLGGDDAVDVAMIAFTFSGIPWMTSGYAMPWNDVDYIDLSREYWSQSMSENIAVNGYSFLIQGKINWTSVMTTQVCFFNDNVATDNRIEDLYALVDAGDWTFDKCATLAKAYAKDVNNDGIKDEEDKYGIIQSFYGGVYNWSIAADYIMINSTDEGLELNYDSEKMADIVNFCYDLFYGGHTTYIERFDYVQDSKGAKIFFNDNALFMFTDLGHADFFRNEKSNYGIIPCPKYDETQEKYCTTNDQWGLSCAIPSTATNPSRTGAITEALCALSAKLVYPVYYDEVLSERNTRDEESKRMLNLIFSNIVYDVGITLAFRDTYIPLYKLMDEKKPSSDLASWIGRYSSNIKTQFDDLYEYVADNYE
ncbi:MAG: hypothetical protein E7618_02350 [Ruminococcaceae bacterium]|nr:hypothetical protein [Oscillospiraceae bacterium]